MVWQIGNTRQQLGRSPDAQDATESESDEYWTPEEAVDILVPFLPRWASIWEPAAGRSRMLADRLRHHGFLVVATGLPDHDFMTDEPRTDCEIIITNPPYSIKGKWVQRCAELGQPFCLLLPVDGLDSRSRWAVWHEMGLQMIVPDGRISFVMGDGGERGHSPFLAAWFCCGLQLERDLNFVQLPKRMKKPQGEAG